MDRYPECVFCKKFELATCVFHDNPHTISLPTITPISEGAFIIFSDDILMQDNVFVGNYDFDESIKKSEDALTRLHSNDINIESIDGKCKLVRLESIRYKLIYDSIYYLGCAIIAAMKQPNVSKSKSKCIYEGLDSLLLFIQQLRVSSKISPFSTLPELSLIGRKEFKPLFSSFIQLLEQWVVYSYKQVSTYKNAYKKWYVFSPLLIQFALIFNCNIADSILQQLYSSTDENKEHSYNKVSTIPINTRDIKIQFLKDAFILPQIRQHSDVVFIEEIMQCTNNDSIDYKISLDFVTSIATSYFLYYREQVNKFEKSDKTFVVANALKSIESLLSVCLIYIGCELDPNSGLTIRYTDKGPKDELLQDYDLWLGKVTLGNLNYAIKAICNHYQYNDSIFYNIQNWISICRNGYFHKHGLEYGSWEGMMGEDNQCQLPSLESILSETLDLMISIIGWLYSLKKTGPFANSQ